MSNNYHKKYSELFAFIENGCQQINEERDFVSYLKSMNQVDTIEEMIGIFDNIYKLLAIIIHSNNTLPNYWYIYEYWGKSERFYVEVLFDWLNESILMWLESQDSLTDELCKKCIVNLREGVNLVSIQLKILAKIEDYKSLKIYDLIKQRNSMFSTRQKISAPKRAKDKKFMDYYIEEYKSISSILTDNGLVLDIIDNTFAKHHNIDFEALLCQYKEEKRIKTETEKKIERRKKIKKTGLSVFAIIGFILSMSFLWYVIEELGFIGLIVLLGLWGALFSFL